MLVFSTQRNALEQPKLCFCFVFTFTLSFVLFSFYSLGRAGVRLISSGINVRSAYCFVSTHRLICTSNDFECEYIELHIHTQFESCFGDLFCWLYFGSFSLLVFCLVCSMNHTAFWSQSINCCARILALCELATHQPRRSICNWIGRWSLAAWYSVWLVVVNHLEN